MGGNVLVVDNHPEILDLTRAMLARASYSVLTAASGEEALETLGRPPHVDLVLSEVTMPGLSGSELAGRVKQLYPDTAVMLMTGFTDQPLDPDVPFLEKPFTAGTLLERVEQVLAKLRVLSAGAAAAIERNAELRASARAVFAELDRIFNRRGRQHEEGTLLER